MKVPIRDVTRGRLTAPDGLCCCCRILARSHISFQDVEPYDGAGRRNRTPNLLLTKQLLCQLSYTGVSPCGIAPGILPGRTSRFLRAAAYVCHASIRGEADLNGLLLAEMRLKPTRSLPPHIAVPMVPHPHSCRLSVASAVFPAVTLSFQRVST